MATSGNVVYTYLTSTTVVGSASVTFTTGIKQPLANTTTNCHVNAQWTASIPSGFKVYVTLKVKQNSNAYKTVGTFQVTGGSGSRNWAAVSGLSCTQAASDTFTSQMYFELYDDNDSYVSGATYTRTGTGQVWWNYNYYTITYNGNGSANTPTSGSKKEGTAYTLASAITRSSSTTTVNTTITTTFNATANGGASNSTKTSTRTDKTTTSYTFSKWALNSTTGTKYSAGGSYTTNASATFYATWSTSSSSTTTCGGITFPAIPSHANGSTSTTRKVYYNANGASGTTPSAQTVTPTATITYSANKWWTTSTGGTSYAVGATIWPWQNTTYYARYSSSTGSYSSPTLALAASTGLSKASTTTTTTVTYTVSFNATGQGGGSNPTALTANKVEVTTQPYVFDKWRLNSASGTSYAVGAAYTPTATSATFYATFKNGTATTTTTTASVTLPTIPAKANTQGATTCVTSFDRNGGTSATPTAISSTATINVQWTAENWHLGSTTGTAYAAGAKYTPTANTTMYATYASTVLNYEGDNVVLPSGGTKNSTAQNYTITVYANGGTASTSSINYSLTTNYAFNGWNTNPSATNGLAAGTTITPVEDQTYYAIWAISSTTSYTITLPTATKEDNVFTGWYTAGGAKLGDGGASYTITPDNPITEIYARYTERLHNCCYVFYNDVWNKCSPWIYDGTTWIQTNPYIYFDGNWNG